MNEEKKYQHDSPYEGYGEEKVSWYIDVPKRLALEFDRIFPDRGSHVILVVTAVAYAIRKGPEALDKLYEELNEHRVHRTGQRDSKGDDRLDSAVAEDGPESSDLH